MKVFVAGNPLVKGDSIALRVAAELGKKNKFHFERIGSISELKPVPKELWLLDAAKGISKVQKITDLKKLERQGVVSLHDFDIAAELLLYKKLGIVQKAVIIAIPPDYPPERAAEEVEQLLQR
jgi:Ni,Fe-hydrogenase maturation factor